MKTVPKRDEFCGRLAAKKSPKVREVQVRVYATCPNCQLDITPAEGKQYWTAGDIREVGMFKGFDCPDCGIELRLPLALFSLHQEAAPPLRAVRGGSRG